MFINIIIWFLQSRRIRLFSQGVSLCMGFGTSVSWWTHIKRITHRYVKMLLTAIFNVAIGMGPYYLNSTYMWMKMALWDAPTRVILDVQLEQMRLERNLSEEESADEKQEWKNTTSHLLRTNTVSRFCKRLNLCVPTFSVSFGKKYFTVHNQSNLHLLPGNVQLIPDCRRLLCPETSCRC